MADQLFYNTNCLPDFAGWTELSNASVNAGVLTIASGGYARVALTNTNAYALSASNVLRIGFTGTCDLQDADNFMNYFNVIVEGVTAPDSTGDIKYFRYNAVINKLRSQFDNVTKDFGFAQDLDSLNSDFTALSLTLTNTSNRTIAFDKAALVRSQDAVSLDNKYYGTSLSRAYGLKVEREDGVSATTINSDVWEAVFNGKQCLYYDIEAVKFIFNGTLSADVINALSDVISPYVYSENGAIVNAIVRRLRTDLGKPFNYLNNDTSDVPYQDIGDSSGVAGRYFILSVVDLTAQPVQFTLPFVEGVGYTPLWWFNGFIGGSMTTQESSSIPTGGTTSTPVMVYVYNDIVVHKEELKNTTGHWGVIQQFGTGIDSYGRGAGIIEKDETYFKFIMKDGSGAEIGGVRTSIEKGVELYNPITHVWEYPSGGGGGATPITAATLSTYNPMVGDVLSASVEPVGATKLYVWQVDGAQVGTDLTYTVITEDVGKTIKLTVVGIGDYYGAVSQATQPVKAKTNDYPIPAGSLADYPYAFPLDYDSSKTKLMIAEPWVQAGSCVYVEYNIVDGEFWYDQATGKLYTNMNPTQYRLTTHSSSQAGGWWSMFNDDISNYLYSVPNLDSIASNTYGTGYFYGDATLSLRVVNYGTS